MKVTANKNKHDLSDYLFHQGTNYSAYQTMGAHLTIKDGEKGVLFRVWAPKADKVSVVGDFNAWNAKINPMNRVTDGGIFETFIKGVENYSLYKYAVKRGRKTVLKADPYAFYSEVPPKSASVVYDLEGYKWKDDAFIKNRKAPYENPVNIYEVNLSSWKRHEDGGYYTYKELIKELIPYVKEMGYTHVEFMPVAEHPFDGSWGYQVTGFYSMTSRFGEPKDFMALIDAFHKAGIYVICDWVPAHFPKDEFGLIDFDGSPCYENQGWDRKEHKVWGTRIFDLGRQEVQSFLISNALFMFDKFHVDGLRVDAVACMLYLDFDKKPGEWLPNQYGERYNLESIAFLKKLNVVVFEKYPHALMIAEESTAYPMVTGLVSEGGLGFNYKWNMGWMHDVLEYASTDPYFRSHIHNKMTFPMCYSFTENYVLPFSHDEVVHGKKSLLDKMSGDVPKKFANLRTLLAFMFAHPGKKLNFMGYEYGQFKEWDYEEGLEFFMLKFDLHNKLLTYNKCLNKIYKETPQLYQIERSWEGFNWVSADEKDNNVFVLERTDKEGNLLLAVYNFSGNDYSKYRIGANKGTYRLILNSDAKKFGGEGKVKGITFKTVKRGAHGRKNSIKVELPKFSALYFIKE